MLIALTASSLLLLPAAAQSSITTSATLTLSGYIQSNPTSNFIIKAADTGLNVIKPSAASYQTNWATIIKDTLGCNTLRFMCGGEGDVWRINMVQNPNTWAANLESLLQAVDNAGLKCYFYTLGDVWGGELGIIDTGSTFMDITLAKTYIDKLAGNNSLNHNFITDPRIAMWSVANEAMIGTVSSSGVVTTNSNYQWIIQMCDYIGSKGGKVVVPSPRVTVNGDDWNSDFKYTEPLLRGHVDYLEAHRYGIWDLATYCSLGNQQYNWTEWKNIMQEQLQAMSDYRGDFSMQKIILGEFGIWRGTGSDQGLTNWTFTDQNRVDYYTNMFQAINNVGLENVCFHYSIEENAYYGSTEFCRYGMISPVPDGIHFTGPSGQTYPGCEVIEENFG